MFATPVFDHPLFSPDVIILFGNLDTGRLKLFKYKGRKFFLIPRVFEVTRVITEYFHYCT